MGSNAVRRCPVILSIAAVVVSISISGCQSTTAPQVTVKTELSPDQAMTPGDEDTFELALSLAAEERHSEAREVLDPLLQRNPDHTRARVLDGVLRAREGRVDHAIEIFETLRREKPDMSEPYNNLAVLYAVERRLDDARQILLESLERRPDAVTYANLGEVYAKLANDANERAREYRYRKSSLRRIGRRRPSPRVRRRRRAPRRQVRARMKRGRDSLSWSRAVSSRHRRFSFRSGPTRLRSRRVPHRSPGSRVPRRRWRGARKRRIPKPSMREERQPRRSRQYRRRHRYWASSVRTPEGSKAAAPSPHAALAVVAIIRCRGDRGAP